MEALGKKLFVTVDESKMEERKTGVQADFTPKIIKPTTAVINYVGDLVTTGRFKIGDKIFIGENYPDKPTEIPNVGVYTIISEDSVISKL